MKTGGTRTQVRHSGLNAAESPLKLSGGSSSGVTSDCEGSVSRVKLAVKATSKLKQFRQEWSPEGFIDLFNAFAKGGRT
jgi:hypothetical protein